VNLSNLYFWLRQEAYIRHVFLPSVSSSWSFHRPGSPFILSFRKQHYRLWHLGKGENCSDQILVRLKTLFAVAFAMPAYGESRFRDVPFYDVRGNGVDLLGKGSGSSLRDRINHSPRTSTSSHRLSPKWEGARPVRRSDGHHQEVHHQALLSRLENG